ncbi:MAG TPA: aromatic ring-hydroxylating dioxygenase subunit alpha [Acidimicrobiales bacterium]
MNAVAETGETESVWLREQWWPAIPSSRVRRKALATGVLDQDLVIFRGSGGQVAALSNRCAHRGVELSLGRVADGTLACRYHGWRYDTTGSCVEIPSLNGESIPSTAKVCSFNCVEQDGYVWVSLAKEPYQPNPPRIERFARTGGVQGSAILRCDWKMALENNLDWCHPVFTHPWTHPQFYMRLLHGSQDSPYELRTTESGFVMFWPPVGENDPTPEDPDVLVVFELPNRVTVSVRHLLGDKGPRIPATIFHFVPTGDGVCRVEFMFPVGGTRYWYTPRGGPILAQDRVVLESAQRTGARSQVSVKADASTLLFRRVLNLAAEGEWPEGRAAIAARKVVPARI